MNFVQIELFEAGADGVAVAHQIEVITIRRGLVFFTIVRWLFIQIEVREEMRDAEPNLGRIQLLPAALLLAEVERHGILPLLLEDPFPQIIFTRNRIPCFANPREVAQLCQQVPFC